MFEKRKSKRTAVEKNIVLATDVVCQVIDVNQSGISFRCCDGNDFPDELSIDIYDTAGLSMEQLQVQKVWKKRLNGSSSPAPFVMAFGWKFKNLSVSQEAHLKFYLQQFEEVPK